MVRHHHERLDGTGYPAGLVGEQIPLGARIIAVADTFDAITSERPYRDASTHKKAINILKEDAGSRLDPAVVAAFCSFYAGRRPMAVWTIVASFPERAFAWLGGGLGSVASSAKAVALAVLVGGAAVTTSAIAGPIPAHKSSTARPHPLAAARAQDSAHTGAPARRLVASSTVRSRDWQSHRRSPFRIALKAPRQSTARARSRRRLTARAAKGPRRPDRMLEA
jgi:hypothetical protein